MLGTRVSSACASANHGWVDWEDFPFSSHGSYVTVPAYLLLTTTLLGQDSPS